VQDARTRSKLLSSTRRTRRGSWGTSNARGICPSAPFPRSTYSRLPLRRYPNMESIRSHRSVGELPTTNLQSLGCSRSHAVVIPANRTWPRSASSRLDPWRSGGSGGNITMRLGCAKHLQFIRPVERRKDYGSFTSHLPRPLSGENEISPSRVLA